MKYNYVSHDSNVFERIEREIVFLRDFHTFVTNVTVDSSSRSQRLSDLHIFYATFFPAFFVVICVFLGVGCYLWMRHKDKPTLKYDQINLDVATNGNENKKTVVEVEKFYQWSL
mmetsp:Transcript_13054/g.14127  ORF Transcript_13054/g.14127 Transcript_13054/m.14127 type:complete len:114 (-) Transcript_13054:549-890(-)